MARVPVVLDIIANRNPSVSAALSGLRKDFGEIGNVVDTVKLKAAGFAGGLTTGLLALGTSVLQQAGSFEQLKAQLFSVSANAEEAGRSFQTAANVAANSPFDVKGVVSATVSLQAFKQKAGEVLPLAGNLAAAFGKPIEEGAAVLGKAFSGSTEGLESLRNTFGISTLDINRFGGVLSDAGGISMKTAGDLAKAKNAITQLIQTRFGDAMARQANTLFGAFSNLGDAVQRAAAAFGTTLIPLATTVTRGITAMVESFEALPAPLQSVVAYGALAATAFAGVSTAVLGLLGLVGNALPSLLAFGRALGGLGTSAATAGQATVTVLANAAVAKSADGAVVSVTNLGVAVDEVVVAEGLWNRQLLFTGTAITGLNQIVPQLTGEILLLREALGQNALPLRALSTGAKEVATDVALIGPSLRGIAPAAEVAAVQISNVERNTGTLGASAKAFMGIGYAPILLALGAGAGLATLAIDSMEQANVRAGESISKTARIAHDAVLELRQLGDIFKLLTGAEADYVRNAKTGEEVVAAFEAALSRTVPADVLARFEKAGLTVADFREKIQAARDSLASNKEELM